ncbi:ornithine cyclodeaminase family protein [Acidicapsa acidisoli]|uniref:ornithine cyclodeaminase family protein n=1 Tax=Acidicapsa acidisoli TaxID=1615681 RepID=UPI0021E023AE|nr:ornithine cyclodeaminase family protein [Acidicapsa acidisoli]
MYIPEEKIRQVLTYESLIPAIRQALIDYSAGRVEQPLRQVLRVKDTAGKPIGWFAVMPVISGEYMAVKTVTFYPGNASLGGRHLHTHLATIELLDRATGEPLAVMDGRLITEMRTAAVSAVAASALAPSAKTLGILGSGVQARAHIQALRHVQPAFREPGSIRIWSRNPEKSAAIAAELGANATSIEEAAASDVVVTVTSAIEPVLHGKWLAPESLVIAVGAIGPNLRELDDETMRGYLIAESRQGSENESGDVILSGAKVQAEIGEILAGTAPMPAAGRRVFKSLGMAIEDLTGAVQVWHALKHPLKHL